MIDAEAAPDDEPLPTGAEHLAACLNLSHELRTPANAILGHVDLLLTGAAGPLSSEIRESLREIQQAAAMLSTRIDDVVRCAEKLPVPAGGSRTNGLSMGNRSG